MLHSFASEKSHRAMDRATPKPESREQAPPIHSVSNQSRLQRLQRRADQNAEPVTVPPIVHEELRAAGQPLEAGTRASMEPRFGVDLSPVRVHTGARAAESAQAVNALAYTVGQDIVFGEGQYAPHTNEGQRTLAHELTHTIQQGPGLQRIPDRLEVSSPADASEREATAVADGVMDGQSVAHSADGGLSIARDPAPAPAPAKKTVTVNHTKLDESTGSLDSAITFANTKVYNQADVQLKKGMELKLDGPKSKGVIGNDLILDEYADPTKPTVEEKALFKLNQTDGAVTAYFVKDLSSGKTTGEALWPSLGVGLIGVVMGNKGIDQTFSHELGHVLLNNGDHDVPDDTYLMDGSVGAAKTKLTPAQITKVKASPFVK